MPGLILVGLFLLLVLTALLRGIPAMQDDLSARSLGALQTAGLDDVAVGLSFSGRDANLVYQSRQVIQAGKAKDIISGLDGVRRVFLSRTENDHE